MQQQVSTAAGDRLNAAAASFHAGRYDAALDLCQAMVDESPADPRALHLAAAALLRLGETEQALALVERAIAAEDGDWTFHSTHGCVLHELERWDEAIACYHRALRIVPGRAEVLNNLGRAHHERGEDRQAEECYRRAAAAGGDCLDARYNLGNLHRQRGDWDDALACYDHCLAARPDWPQVRLNRALLLLTLGRFVPGWEEYEWRWRQPGGPPPRDGFAQPPWGGEPLAGRTILVHGEQGVGDEVMFASCFPELIAQSRSCWIACDARLAGLFSRSFPTARVIGVPVGDWPRWRPPAESGIDVQIAAGSVPKFLRRDESSFPRAVRFLSPDAQRTQIWKRRYDSLGEGPKIGISWRAGRRASEQKWRCTELSDWRALLSTPGTHFVNLQHGESGRQTGCVRRELGVRLADWDDTDDGHDLDELAARIAALDLVIAVDNTTVHLAGAVGTPVWVLLPRAAPWRWLAGGERSPWYGRARLVRQSRPGDWRELLARARDDLACSTAGNASMVR